MKIIELVGLPGCGKSTIIKMVTDECHNSFVLRDELIKTKIPWTWARRYAVIAKLTGALTPFYIRSKMDKKEKHYYILIKMILHLAYFSDKKNDSILLLDEGLVQHFTSLVHGENLDEGLAPIISKELKTFNPIIINCDIPIEIAGERIMIRNRKRDRFRTDNRDQQYRLLRQKRKNLDFVIGLYGSPQYTICMEEEKATLKRKLLNILKECCENS